MRQPFTQCLLAVGLGLATLAMTSQSQAELLAYEGFDYTPGGFNTTEAGLDGGTGWSGAWSNDVDGTIVSGSLSMPNLLLASTGNSASGKAFGTVRYMSTSVNLASDQDYYFSYLLQRHGATSSTSGEWSNAGFRQSTTYSAVGGVSSSELFQTERIGNNTAGTLVAENDTVYLVVVKIAAVATGNDQIFLQAYSATDTIGAEPTTEWTVVGDVEDNADLADNFVISVGGGAAWSGADIDEIRIGTTWADVTGFAGNHPGDANGDGMVNLADLQILGDNWQSTTASWSQADFTGDGNVNLADLQILGDNWGYGVSSDLSFDLALAGVAIPEPATISLLLAAVMTPCILRRAANH